MTKQFRPMLAAPIEDRKAIRFPVLASEKLDGLRALVKDGVLVSRKLLPFPNQHLQKLFGKPEFNGFDGELLLNNPIEKVFDETQSAAMTEDGEPDVTFWVFDDFTFPANEYKVRIMDLQNRVANAHNDSLKVLDFYVIDHLAKLETYEANILLKSPIHGQKGEGIMIRDPSGPYKYNRSTVNEGWLLKVKRFKDSDARILGFKERLQNTNVKERDELGLAKRSHKKEGKVLTGMLGSFIVQDIHSGVKFDVGSGLTIAERKAFWNDQESLRGRVLKYKYFEEAGKGKPRFPTFLCLRDDIDVLISNDEPEELF